MARRLALMACAGTVVIAATAPQAAMAQDTDITMSQTRPRLVVLMHGVTSEKQQAPEEGITTSKHARWYWGSSYITGVMGFPTEPAFRVITPRTDGSMRLRTTPLGYWNHKTFTREATNELAPVIYPMSWLNGDLSGIATNPTEIKNYVRLMTKPGPNPVTAVMVTYRDGSKHLMPQTAQAIDQIYDTYKATFGHLAADAQPQIYLVGHSFGSIIARAIIANPTGGDLWGNKLTATQRSRADFIRRRTVFVNTIAGPHQGTPSPDYSGDIAAFIKSTGKTVEQGAAGIDAVMKIPPFSWLGVKLDFATKVRSGVAKAMDKIAGERECLQDLARVNEYNTGILKPDTARRGATGSLVPIYTMGGRNPGGLFYDRTRAPFVVGGLWLPYSIIDLFGGERHQSSAAFLIGIESLMHEAGYGLEGKRPYGTAKSADADQFTSPFKGIGPAAARPVSAGINLAYPPLISGVLWGVAKGNPTSVGADGENDSDGFVGIDSANAASLPGTNWYRLFNRGVYGGLNPWDLHNHESILHNSGTGLYLQNELIREAGPYVASGQRLSRWPFQGPAVRPNHNVKVEVLEVTDVLNNLDTFSQADFRLTVKIAEVETSQNGPDNKKTVTNFKATAVSGIPTSVIPIKISVIERDDTDPNDYCSISGVAGRDNATLYFDTRTQTISGDVIALSGDTFILQGLNGVTNRVRVKVRITGS
jgi:hypothetical protein